MGYVSSVSSNVSAYEPVSTSGEVSFSGLGNGTDFQEIIDVTIAAESFQKEEYEAQKEETEYLIDLLEQLEEEVDNLNETLDEMDEPDEFYSVEGTSSDDAVSVDVTGEAATGTHVVVVDQLAQHDIWVNTENGYASKDTVIADTATTLELEVDGETISIDVNAGTTLSGLESQVNSDPDTRDKVEADIMFDGDEYFFVLKSVDSGADNAITITSTGTLNGMDMANFTNTQTGQNARIRVDGFPADPNEWIERDTNSIDDVVDGITFELKETTNSEGATISVEYDTESMQETIEEFVSSVNQIILDIQLLTGRVVQEEDDELGYTVDSIVLDIMYSDIKNILSSGALGFSTYDEVEGGDTYNALSQLGFYTDTDEGSDTYGQIIIDEDELEAALDNDPVAVADLFCAKAEIESDSDNLQAISVIKSVTPSGEHEVEYTVSGGVLVSATINGEEASVDPDNWTILGTGDTSTGLYVGAVNQADGTHSGTVRVKQGKVGELSDALDSFSDGDTGSLTILIENYEASVTRLDNDIYNEEARLDTLETSLTRKYASLEATLSYYENLSAQLSSQLASLG